MPQEMVIRVHYSIKYLQDELKLKKRNGLISKGQFEFALKHEQTMTNEHRTQMKNMVLKLDFLSKRMGEENG